MNEADIDQVSKLGVLQWTGKNGQKRNISDSFGATGF